MKSLASLFSDSRVWIGVSGLGWLASLVALVGQDQTITLPDGTGIVISGGPGIIHFLVASAGLLTIIFILRRRWKPWLAVLVLALACGGLCASLLYRDDYSGGSCGPDDWASGHLHAGYPYSWMDGFICVEHGYTIPEYLAAHPDKQGWRPDFLALGVDALFWVNAALIVAAPLAVFSERKVVRNK
ncbi:MAG: hypothetical protein ACOYYU_02085 [Chloroflexota bacterium]